MVEITKQGSYSKKKRSGTILLCLAILLLSYGNFSQQGDTYQKTGKKKIEVIHSDEVIDETEAGTGKKLTRLLGSVQLKHNEIFMNCDSAHFFPGFNQIEAYSRIHIYQGDTLSLHGDYLFYDGTTETAVVKGNVELIDKETHLFTNTVNYDVKNEIARYNEGGRITNGNNELTSITGIYYVSSNLFHFKDSVKIVNPDYIMSADTMDYNTKSETAFFTGPSELKGDSLYLYCEKGWYDTKNDISRIWKNAFIDNKQQLIRGDSLYYEGQTGHGQAYRNISITDTTENIVVTGNYAWYYKTPERFMVTDRAMFIQISENDSLFLHADTIKAVTAGDSDKTYRLLRAYYGCRMFSKDLQAKCDSLSYSFQDSVIRMYYSPVIWSEENQLTAEKMAIFTKNRKADRLELNNSAFVVSQLDPDKFNQIKGRNLTGFFRNNELYRINIDGNGETIYYLVDGDRLVGVNKARCSKIEIFVEDGKITEIYEYDNPEGVIDPPVGTANDNLRLEGFNWLDSLRPGEKSDIFKK